jgi:stage II sporulation protein D
MKRLALLAALVAALHSMPAAGGVAEDRLAALARAAGQVEPIMRIGLDDGTSVRLSAKGGLRILDPETGMDVWRPAHEGEIVAVPEGVAEEGVGTVHRIQVAAYSSQEAAEREMDALAARFGVPAVVRHDPDRGSWRVRVGEAADREALSALLERLRGEGFSGLWIAEEPAREDVGGTIRLVDTTSWESVPTGLSRIALAGAGGGPVKVEDKPYRGVFEVRLNPYGKLRAVNWVGLETYLLGVVPAELGPAVWPQLEALKAQAVAARTYAWKHRGQFGDEGFDLCATPRCQVYGGKSAEHPMSDRAVWATRGEILTWRGEPITALYTATCGGHTEDAGNVFVEEEAPYLKGVPCRAETETVAAFRAVIDGRKIQPVSTETGDDVTRDWALLTAAGILDESLEPKDLTRPITGEDLHRWTSRLASQAGRPSPTGTVVDPADLGEAAALLLQAARWSERAEILLADADLDVIVRTTEIGALPDEQRRALAYLFARDALSPNADGKLGLGRRPSRARMLPALSLMAEAYRLFDLRTASVVSVRGDELLLFEGRGDVSLRLARRPFLFGRTGSSTVPVSSLVLYPGDKVRFRTGADGRVDLVELHHPVNGISDDRISKVYAWEVRRTGREIEAAVNRRVDVGRLRDLQVVRRGVSGRVAELRVVGSRASTVVKGFDIRRLLGLSEIRDTLVVIEVQKDSDGRVRSAVFSGKGWGHGVGLCQVGAYGMALRGRSYREILSHYYRGASMGQAN